MGDHNSYRAFGERLLGGPQHPVPVPGPDVVRPHVPQLDRAYPGYRTELWYRVQELVWLEARGDGARGVVDLAGYRPPRVNQVDQWEGLVLWHWLGLLVRLCLGDWVGDLE